MYKLISVQINPSIKFQNDCIHNSNSGRRLYEVPALTTCIAKFLRKIKQRALHI